jgi:anti-sigma regulatory factor (Ser/Thr protein kinase)
VPAHAEEIAGIRSAVLAFAEVRGITKAARDDIVLAVSEACTNVVVHAYIDAAVPGSLTVTSAYVSEELVVTVRDEGRGMLARADSPGLGLGLAIISRLASQAEFGPNGTSGTEVRMTFAAATEQA